MLSSSSSHRGGDWTPERLNTTQSCVPDTRLPGTVRVHGPPSALPGTASQSPRPGTCFPLCCCSSPGPSPVLMLTGTTALLEAPPSCWLPSALPPGLRPLEPSLRHLSSPELHSACSLDLELFSCRRWFSLCHSISSYRKDPRLASHTCRSACISSHPSHRERGQRRLHSFLLPCIMALCSFKSQFLRQDTRRSRG